MITKYKSIEPTPNKLPEFVSIIKPLVNIPKINPNTTAMGLEIINKTRLKVRKKVKIMLFVPKYWLLSSSISEDPVVKSFPLTYIFMLVNVSPYPLAITQLIEPLEDKTV